VAFLFKTTEHFFAKAGVPGAAAIIAHTTARQLESVCSQEKCSQFLYFKKASKLSHKLLAKISHMGTQTATKEETWGFNVNSTQ
jgi:hypothetical protein